MKLGSFSIPLYRLDKTLQATKAIYDEFRSDEVGREDVGPLLGHKSSASGALAQKIADMRAYGLIDGGRDKFRVSSIGKDATYGTPDEKDRAIQKAVRNIPLWSIFLERYGNSIKEENFWVNLRKITGVESPDAQKNAKAVRNAYMADVRLIKTVGEPTKTVQSQEAFSAETADRTFGMEAQQIGPKTAIVSIESQGLRTRIEIKDCVSYNFVMDTLRSMKKMLNLEEKQDQGYSKNKGENEGGSETEKSKTIDAEKNNPT